jgi:hypothetical protein
MNKIYSGIGARATPMDIILDMQLLSKIAVKLGWILRSGGANGADTAFEEGCDVLHGKKEIYLPWSGFNGNTSSLVSPSDRAVRTANTIHPAFISLKPAAKLLVSRNMHQVMGQDMNTPTDCVICWTPDGCESLTMYSRKTGGTGTAIALASLNNIPIFNLKNSGRWEDALHFLVNPDEATTIQL